MRFCLDLFSRSDYFLGRTVAAVRRFRGIVHVVTYFRISVRVTVVTLLGELLRGDVFVMME